MRNYDEVLNRCISYKDEIDEAINRVDYREVIEKQKVKNSVKNGKKQKGIRLL